MKIYADFTQMFKIVVVCLVIGFVSGLCINGTSWLQRPVSVPVAPAPDPSAVPPAP